MSQHFLGTSKVPKIYIHIYIFVVVVCFLESQLSRESTVVLSHQL